ncbi:MAG: aminoglycoside phosphotransferase family protein [Pseudomonadota bacterium]
MTADHPPPRDALKAFGATDAVFVTSTNIAAIWRVASPHGPAALKLYHGRGLANEAAGFDMLKAWNGRGAARLYGLSGPAALIEWLDGPSLGDRVREGRGEAADATLTAAAGRLHGPAPAPPQSLPLLADWCVGLFDFVPPAGWPDADRASLARAADLARRLLASPRDIAPLHGDFHHDNVIRGARGWTAFDAKGVLGERAYELANAFRNPKGAPAFVDDPARRSRLVALGAAALGVDAKRLRAWAAAKCALSIVWRAKRADAPPDPEAALLARLLDEAGTV